MVIQKTKKSPENIRSTVPVISFIGSSGSGKTTLLKKIVHKLKNHNYRVAIVKHTHHSFDIDQPGKDTMQFYQAGSDIVAISSPDKMALIERVDEERSLSQIVTLVDGNVDIVLTEGYKNSSTAKIIVLSNRENEEKICSEGVILTTVSANKSPQGIPQFHPGDVDNIVSLLIEQMEKPRDTNGTDAVVSENGHYQACELDRLLAESADLHGHICAGQVLGVRMAMRGCKELGIKNPKEDKKRLIVYVETDRCATDAIQIVTGCKLGKRTMKYMDYGKLAATFVDLHTGEAVRLVAREDAREKASLYRYRDQTKHEAELAAYKVMPDEDLFDIEHVLVQIPDDDMPGPPRRRVICEQCGEGINDNRDVTIEGKVLCRSCAYGGYYQRHDKNPGN